MRDFSTWILRFTRYIGDTFPYSPYYGLHIMSDFEPAITTIYDLCNIFVNTANKHI